VPRLRDDALYQRAFEVASRVMDEELRAFRRRLATRVIAKVDQALLDMGEHFDEALLRRALADYDRVYVEESMQYIRSVLIRSGEIEIAKRLAELAGKVGVDDLPEPFRSGYVELERAGTIGRLLALSQNPRTDAN